MAVARALSRNPKPLLIVSGHIQRDEALATPTPDVPRNAMGTNPTLDVDSELVEVWADWDEERRSPKHARYCSAEEEPAEEALRELAGDVFLTSSRPRKTMWWESLRRSSRLTGATSCAST